MANLKEMQRMNTEAVMELLGELDVSTRTEVLARMAYENKSTRQRNARTHAPDHANMWEVFVEAARPTHIVPLYKAVENVKGFNDAMVMLDSYLTEGCRPGITSAQKLAVAQVVARLVVRYLKARKRVVAGQTIVNVLPDVDRIVDAAFPGYADPERRLLDRVALMAAA